MEGGIVFTMTELQISSLSKSYGNKPALNHISLLLVPGVYGLLGPNGAGKSTLMNIIAGNLAADAGDVLYNGLSTIVLGKHFRSVLGFMPQHQGLYDHFTGHRFLSYIAGLKGMPSYQAKIEIENVLHLVNLQEQGAKKLGAYSGGMKQRILIAQALINSPKILILDEPTAGLDPKERIRVRNIISEIAMDRIVILATHVVSDVEQIAKEVILIKKGNILRQGSVQSFFSQMRGHVFEMSIKPEQLKEVEETYLVSNISYNGDYLLVHIVTDHEPIGYDCLPANPTLEDVYLHSFADEATQ
jgi:ABC-type multidrug transport system ATPase subunit